MSRAATVGVKFPENYPERVQNHADTPASWGKRNLDPRPRFAISNTCEQRPGLMTAALGACTGPPGGSRPRARPSNAELGAGHSRRSRSRSRSCCRMRGGLGWCTATAARSARATITTGTICARTSRTTATRLGGPCGHDRPGACDPRPIPAFPRGSSASITCATAMTRGRSRPGLDARFSASTPASMCPCSGA